ncbi:hypothetical protein KSP40_PGU017261 [Platanthera guangdongensis]|uniref:Uncharacterized protein n=1 Tax=Platanthera guangdongensis TaxID=2320717 RepID=A0ABR2LS49_9ASPA
MARDWGRRRRQRACVKAILLICFSPVLLPLLFLFFPIRCIAAVFLRIAIAGPQIRREWRRSDAGVVFRCQEEGGAAVKRELLHRYLEDQMGLVAGVLDSVGGRLAGDEDLLGA